MRIFFEDLNFVTFNLQILEWKFLPKSPFVGISKVRSSSIESQNSCHWGPLIENPLDQMNFTLVRTDRWFDSTWYCYCLLPWHEIQYQYLNPHNSPESNPDPTESLPLSKSPVTREKNIEEKKKITQHPRTSTDIRVAETVDHPSMKWYTHDMSQWGCP